MKILLLVNSHLPAIGGRELVVHNLAMQYLKAGHDVTVGGMAGLISDRHIRFAYPVSRWPVFSRWPLAGRWAVGALHALTHRYDIVHAHATYPSGYIAILVRSLFRAPIVVTPHGEDINIVLEIKFGQRLDPVQRPLIEATVRRADAVTAISQTVHASLLDAGAPESRIHDIANGVDMERFAGPPLSSVPERFGFPPGTPLIVSIGNYHAVKGHQVLVDAVALAHSRGQKLGLVIVGRTSAEFCQLVASRGFGGFIKFAGVLPVPTWNSKAPDLLAELLVSSRIYVSASIGEGAEGLSLSLLEGMAAGACPVVTDISGNRDMVQDGVNGRVVRPANASAMADALCDLLSDEPTRQRLAAAARQTASRFSWAAVADQYLALYRRLLQH
jgi:glycosyltransferase involved in cell wall biosynthesis